MYRVYFLYPMKKPVDMMPFDQQAFVNYVDWVKQRLGDECLGAGVGLSDLEETQPIFGNYFKGIAWFDFHDRNEAFDVFEQHNFVEIMDKMLEFTVVPCIFQGVFID